MIEFQTRGPDFEDGHRPPGGGFPTGVGSVRTAVGGAGEGVPSIGECRTTICREGNPEIQSNELSPTVQVARTTDSRPRQDGCGRPVGALSRCPCCGRGFTQEYAHQKFCCKKCFYRHNHRLYAERHRDEMNARRRAHMKEKRAETRLAREEAAGASKERAGSADWKAQVLLDLSIQDPHDRFEASKKWTDEQRRYAKSVYMGMLRDDFSYRQGRFR